MTTMRRHGPAPVGGAPKDIAPQPTAVVVGGTLGGLGTKKASGDVWSILQNERCLN